MDTPSNAPYNYDKALSNYMRSPEFQSQNNDQQQELLKLARERLIEDNPGIDVDYVNRLFETENKLYLRGSGRGRAIPDLQSLGVVFPNQEPGFEDLSKEDKVKKIDEFRLSIPEIAALNPTQREDTEYFLDKSATELERRANGENVGWIRDKVARTWEGYVAGLLNYVGADDAAESVRGFFHENPEYDENLTSDLAQGLGSVGSAMTIFIGTALTTKGLGGSATAATRAATMTSLAGNGIMRYQEAYNNAIDAGLSDEKANDAGVAALPAAVIDALGDRILGGNFLPSSAEAAFKAGTEVAKRKALSDLAKSPAYMPRLLEIGKNFFSEGISESVGDLAAAYGPYLVTGVDDYIPTPSEFGRSFIVGGILGGGIASTSQAYGYLQDRAVAKNAANIEESFDKLNPSQQSTIYDLLETGRYREAMETSKKYLEETASPDIVQPQATPDGAQIASRSPEQAVAESNIQAAEIEQGQAPALFNNQNLDNLSETNAQAYSNLTDSIRNQASVIEGQETVDEQGALLDTTVPARPILRETLDSFVSDSISQEQVNSVKPLIDVVAARWLASKPESNLNEFYEKLNINSQESFDQFNQIIQSGSEQNDIRPLLGSMIGSFRSSGILSDILTTEDFNIIKQSLGVEEDFNSDHDVELANRMEQWLQDSENESGLAPVFEKLKSWISDIYQSLSNLLSPEQRNKELDSIFENLFQVTLTPSEFKTKLDTKQSENPGIITGAIQKPESNTATIAAANLEQARLEVLRAMGPISEVDVPWFMESDETAAVDFLSDLSDKIGVAYQDVVNRMLADVVQKNPSLKFQVVENAPYSGKYNASENKVYLGKSDLRTIGHEVAHALTRKDLDVYINPNTADYNQALEDAFGSPDTPEHIKTLIDVYRKSAQTLGYTIGNVDTTNLVEITKLSATEYAFANIHEFVAEAMSSQDFQNQLASIPYEGSTIWSTIADTLSRAWNWIQSIGDPEYALRSNGENSLTATLAAVNEIVNTNPATELNQEQATLEVQSIYSRANQVRAQLSPSESQQLADHVAQKISDIESFLSQEDSQSEWWTSLKEGNPFNQQENYSPAQTRAQKVANFYKRFKEIKALKISDKADQRTAQIAQILGRIKPSEIHLLDAEMQNYFFKLVDNIYEARKSAIQNPQVRMDSDLMMNQLRAIENLINANAVAQAIKDYDGLIDFDAEGIDLNDREAVKARINKYFEDQGITDEIKKNLRSQRAKDRLNKLYIKYRDLYKEMRSSMVDRYADSENFAREIESIYGGRIVDPSVRDMIKSHFDRLRDLNVDGQEGKELYENFFAINNLMDGNIVGLTRTSNTIASSRDIQDKVASMQSKFRDPMVKNKFGKFLDWSNRFAELHQVQLKRFSVYEDARKFLQEKLFGPLYQHLIQKAESRYREGLDQWIQFRARFEESVGRPMNTEDRVILQMFRRIPQWEVGENADAAIKRNIRRERQSLEHILNDNSNEYNKLVRTKILPVFDNAVKSIEQMEEGAAQHFFETMPKRLQGTESEKVGYERSLLLQDIFNLFDSFTLESRIISEGYYGQPFREMTNYSPIDVHTKSTEVDPNQEDVSISDPLDFIQNQDRKTGLKTKASHFYERQEKLRKDQFFSYNLEYSLDRSLKQLATQNGTVVERHILAARLKEGGELDQVISTDANGATNKNRRKDLLNHAKKLVNNSMAKPDANNLLVDALRTGTNIYARVALSGVHHIITQPIAALSDYAVRTGNIQGWMSAALYYSQNSDKIEEFLRINARSTFDRGALEAMSLDRRRAVDETENTWKDSETVKKFNTIFQGAGDVLTMSLRNGDKLSTRITLLAEYQRLLKQRGYHANAFEDIDWNVPQGDILNQAVLNTELNINTSSKALRGDLFSDKNQLMTVLRNSFFAFTSHVGNLATQLNMAIRDVIELVNLGAPASEYEAKFRTIGAIITQSFVFTTSRFVIGSALATGMISLIRDMFDDEDGKIEELQRKLDIAREKGDPVRVSHARNELDQAKTVRTIINKMRQRTTSADSWFKQVIRDESGSFLLGLNNGTVQSLFFAIPDLAMGAIAKSSKDESVRQKEAEIRDLRKRGRMKEAAKQEEVLTNLKSAEYIPLHYPDFNGVEVGGMYGSVIGGYKKTAEEIAKGVIGTKEVNWNDFVLAMSNLGVGQAEVNRFLKTIDSIEDRTFERNKRFEEEYLPEAQQRQVEQEEKERSRLLKQLLR